MKLMQRLMMMMPGHISCKQFEERLDEYVDGELSLWGRFRMAVHKIECAACAAYAAAYAKTISAVKNAFGDQDDQAADETVPEDLMQDIVKKQLESHNH